MGASLRPVPAEGAGLSQEEQARLLRATGDGVPVSNETAALTDEWGEPDAEGTYGRNLEAEDVYGGESA